MLRHGINWQLSQSDLVIVWLLINSVTSPCVQESPVGAPIGMQDLVSFNFYHQAKTLAFMVWIQICEEIGYWWFFVPNFTTRGSHYKIKGEIITKKQRTNSDIYLLKLKVCVIYRGRHPPPADQSEALKSSKLRLDHLWHTHAHHFKFKKIDVTVSSLFFSYYFSFYFLQAVFWR